MEATSFGKVSKDSFELCVLVVEVKEFENLADTVMIHVPKLLELKLHVEVYVHQKGQLMRHILTSNSPEAVNFDVLELQQFSKVNNKAKIVEITISIGNVVVLRNRENGVQKCNATLGKKHSPESYPSW